MAARLTLSLLIFELIAAFAGPARADEGLWPYDAFPTVQVERSLGVKLDRRWLDRARQGSVRLTTGCSGAVLSPQGLVATNHHCVLACLEALSQDGRDRFELGFGADAAEPPASCPGMQAEVLDAIVDVTQPVLKSGENRAGQNFVHDRQSLLAAVERVVCEGDRRYRCQVMSFFGGGQFKVYRYRRWDDVRLVFAPEFPVAFFGGDTDNFTFPRYDVDVAFLRLFERGRPAAPAHWLQASRRPPAAGEPVFAAGSPGTTERDATVEQLSWLRDVALPDQLARVEAVRRTLEDYAGLDPDRRLRVKDRLFEAGNTLKLLQGEAQVLRDPAFLAERAAREGALRQAVQASPAAAASVGDPWSALASLSSLYAARYHPWRQLESGVGAGSRLFVWGRLLVRYADEHVRPAGDRLPEYSEARSALLRKLILDPQPSDPELEAALLTVWLRDLRRTLGERHPAVEAVLAGETPEALAHRLAYGTHLGDPSVRAALLQGGRKAVSASDDPMIRFILATDGLSRAARQVWEEDIIGPTQDASERLAKARFALGGNDIYPDANFTPRLSFGRVQGPEAPARAATVMTTFSGLFGHATGQDPYRLPPRWLAARDRLDPGAVLNFASTDDIVGGSSGSPILDSHGLVIGLAFDGDQGSVLSDFAYDLRRNRSVSVSMAAIGMALDKVYGRADLLNELDPSPR